MLRIRKEARMLIAIWHVVLASIAGISLLVGGIGIFSVMQISISERVYEIGLRKALGATDPEIFGQFLVESVSLSLVGGLAGSALGYAVTLLAGQAFEDGLAVSPLGLGWRRASPSSSGSWRASTPRCGRRAWRRSTPSGRSNPYRRACAGRRGRRGS
jgi:ABC-type antimicrobial peptide transport system permease subunit